MSKKEWNSLKAGDIVIHEPSGIIYVITVTRTHWSQGGYNFIQATDPLLNLPITLKSDNLHNFKKASGSIGQLLYGQGNV